MNILRSIVLCIYMDTVPAELILRWWETDVLRLTCFAFDVNFNRATTENKSPLLPVNQNCFRFFNWFRKKNWSPGSCYGKYCHQTVHLVGDCQSLSFRDQYFIRKTIRWIQSTRDTGSYRHPSWISSLQQSKFFEDRKVIRAWTHLLISYSFSAVISSPSCSFHLWFEQRREKICWSSGWKKTTQRSNSRSGRHRISPLSPVSDFSGSVQGPSKM